MHAYSRDEEVIVAGHLEFVHSLASGGGVLIVDAEDSVKGPSDPGRERSVMGRALAWSGICGRPQLKVG